MSVEAIYETNFGTQYDVVDIEGTRENTCSNMGNMATSE